MDPGARLLANSFSAVQVQAADIHALIYDEQVSVQFVLGCAHAHAHTHVRAHAHAGANASCAHACLQVARLRHWELEEKGELEQMISSLLVSQDILKKEKKKIKAAYHTTFTAAQQQQAAYVKSAAEQYKRAHPTSDVVDLQTKLVELNNRLLDIDLDIKVVNRDLVQATKRDEKELHSTRLVVMQVRCLSKGVCVCTACTPVRRSVSLFYIFSVLKGSIGEQYVVQQHPCVR